MDCVKEDGVGEALRGGGRPISGGCYALLEESPGEAGGSVSRGVRIGKGGLVNYNDAYMPAIQMTS